MLESGERRVRREQVITDVCGVSNLFSHHQSLALVVTVIHNVTLPQCLSVTHFSWASFNYKIYMSCIFSLHQSGLSFVWEGSSEDGTGAGNSMVYILYIVST